MMTMSFVIGVYAFSLLGILSLFALRRREEALGHRYFPRFREAADEYALALKRYVFSLGSEVQKLPPLVLALSKMAIHASALQIAAAARFLERQAFRLADIVSHKRGFVPRAPRSEFIRKIGEYKENDTPRTDNLAGDETTGHNT